MSGRLVRRALQEKQRAEIGATFESDEEEEQAPSAGARNIFDLLGGDEGQEAQEDDAAEDEKTNGSAEAAANQQLEPRFNVQPKSKRSKKKKGKKVKGREEEEETIDQLIEKLDLSTVSAKETPAPIVEVEEPLVLAVNSKYLRPEEELRRIFGAKVIGEVERRERKRRGRVPLRKMNLVTPMEDWPRWEGGMSMEVLDTKDGVTYFRYVHSNAYKAVQEQYEAMVASHNPNNIAMLLMRHPYHVDSLLSMVDLYRQLGEYQRSSMLLEKCLFALEYAWHLWFNPMGGKCRLAYSVPENRPLFLALHRHMQHLGKRGCHRTALEVCKLLLSLEPDDPLGALFYIDYYALRAEQYQWLESFVEKYQHNLSLAVLPNFSYSLSVARFYLEQKSNANGDRVPAIELLQQALMLHPLVFGKIVARAPIQEDEGWRKLLNHPFFAKATAGGPTLEHLIDIYIERNFLIWRAPDLQKLLKEAGSTVLVAAAKGEAANWATARDEAFQSVHNEYQHLRVSDYGDAVAQLPELAQLAAEGAPEAATVDIRDRNPFLVFLESLIPWVNYGEGVGPPSTDEDDDEVEVLEE